MSIDWGGLVDGMFTDIQSRRDRGKELSMMSLPRLDDMIWGLKRKKLTVIGARPSQGKSSLLAQIALDLIQADKKVVYFSWEETPEGLTQRMLNNYGKVDNFLTQSGQFGRKEKDHKAVAGLKNILMKNNLNIIGKRGRTLADFKRLIEQHKQVDCVVVDYIQLIDKKGSSTAKDAYDEFIQEARELAKERNCAMLIASQINRATVQNKQVTPPMMNELKGCIHGDSIVGGKRIQDIVENNNYFPVTSVGGKVTPSRLINVGDKKCLKIKTRSGKEIILSTDTKMYNGNWIKSKDLKVGDNVYIKKI